jgi:hypothetical protein
MISITDHLVTLSKGFTTGSGHAGISSELNENERGPLSYILAWYVLSNLKKKSKSKANDELQIFLEHMISSGLENEYIKARSRGGLATPCINDLVKLLEVVGILFRQFIGKKSKFDFMILG